LKKIALICNYKLLPERVGGMDYFFWEFDKKCKENNIAVDWFFPNISTHGNYKNMIIFYPNEQSLENYFLKHCISKNYTHIITHFVEICTPFFKKIKEKTQAKVIAINHNARAIGGYTIKKKINKKIKGFLYSKYIDVFVGVSQQSVNDLVIDFGNQILKKSIIIHNGINFEKFEKKDVNIPFQNKFIIVSHLAYGKGILELIETVHTLTKKGIIHFEIALYGEGILFSEISYKIAEYQLDTIIKLKGNVSNIYTIYKNYDYLIHPSQAETFGFAIIESLYCKVPVLVSKQANVLHAVEENKNGYLFDIQINNSLELLLEDIILQKRKLKYESKNFNVSKFSLTEMVENHYKLLI